MSSRHPAALASRQTQHGAREAALAKAVADAAAAAKAQADAEALWVHYVWAAPGKNCEDSDSSNVHSQRECSAGAEKLGAKVPATSTTSGGTRPRCYQYKSTSTWYNVDDKRGVNNGPRKSDKIICRDTPVSLRTMIVIVCRLCRCVYGCVYGGVWW